MQDIGNVIKGILDNIGDGIIFIDRNYKIIFANKAVQQLCGLEEEKIIGQACYNFFHKSPVPCRAKGPLVMCPRYEVFKTGKTTSIIHTHILPDGTERFLEVTASPVFNENGEVIQVVEILRDVTERKKAEEAIRKWEEEFRLIFENAKDAIFWADPKSGLIINCNKAAETLLEKKREEIIGFHQETLHPPQKSKYYSEMFKKHIAQKETVDDEAEVITKSGKIKPVHITASVALIGRKQIIQGIFRDITEHKNADEELRAAFKRIAEEKVKSESILSCIGDALTILDVDYRIIYQNRISKEEFGDYIGELCYKVYHQREEICDGCPVYVALKYDKIYTTERIMTDTSGTMYYEITASSLKNPKGEIIGGIEVIRDVTKRKRTEEAIRLSTRRLEILHEIDEAVLSARPTESIVQIALKKTRQLIPCLRASLALFDFKSNQAKIVGIATDTKTSIDMGINFAFDEFGFFDYLEFGEIYIVDDIEALPKKSKVEQTLLNEGVRSAISVPLMKLDELIGSLNIGKDIRFGFTSDEIQIAREVANLLAVVIQSRQAEMSLKESEKKYRELVDNALIGVYKTNLEGNIIFVNKSLAKMFGFESQEMMMQESVLLRYKNPEDRKVLIEHLMKTGSIANFEFVAITKTGETKNILLSASLNGDIISGMLMDVTESAMLEKKLKMKIKELEDFYDFAISRELEMRELKEEIDELKKELRKYRT